MTTHWSHRHHQLAAARHQQPENLARCRRGQAVLSGIDGHQGEAVIDSLADIKLLRLPARSERDFVAQEVFAERDTSRTS